MNNVINFSYNGGSLYIDYLKKYNKLNLLKSLVSKEVVDPILASDIEELLSCDQDNIICLITDSSYKNISQIGYLRLISLYQDNMTIDNVSYDKNNENPTLLYYNDKIKSHIMFYNWKDLKNLEKDVFGCYADALIP